ncbi:MAG: methylated-DNA--[protein]-cysteine S-methyltransferase [Gammaproteobacteria bacterium]|nr:methylated-DNA--[protein]-cysteine S-methyltransferase [Gammaproteobacteria bacterium]
MTQEQVTVDSPIGKITGKFCDGVLCELKVAKSQNSKKTTAKLSSHPLTNQLAAYFKNSQTRFSIPFQLEGTDFQKRVWAALCKIPVGKTLSYGQLAEKLNSSPRAIGNACRHNPIPIIVPCHRVTAKNGIGGYDGKTSGKRLTIKRWLLEHEGVVIN